MISGDAFDSKSKIRDGIDSRDVILEASSDSGIETVPGGFVGDANAGNDAVRWIAGTAFRRVAEIKIEAFFTAEINNDVNSLAIGILLDRWLSGC